jgi:hypothetical protein
MNAEAAGRESTSPGAPLRDLLVRLYDLPSRPAATNRSDGTVIRRVLSFEKRPVVDWVEKEFGVGWAGECEVACCAQPATCFAAVKRGRQIGFSCFDATFRGFFGPLGVIEEERGREVGRGLLLTSLWAMRDAGYAYAIVGATRSVEFYTAVAGAEVIARSFPGAYPPSLESSLLPGESAG